VGAFRSWRQRLRRSLIPTSLLRDIEAMRIAQGRILVELNRTKLSPRLRDYEFKVFSQWGEDGIIQRLIATVPIANTTFIEFGVEDFSESNCRFLMINDHWRGFVLDASQRAIAKLQSAEWLWKYDLRAKCAVVTRENVNELLQSSGFDRDLGILSIDVDGIDYWLLEALDAFAPRILIMEYNSLFGKERKIAVPYDASFSRREKHYSDLYFGASLPALAHLAAKKGYSLVGTENTGTNAFFVRTDLLGADVKALSVDEAFVESRVRQSRDREGRLDYLPAEARFAAIKGLPVVNVETGALEQI
jgi:hypothetical protein